MRIAINAMQVRAAKSGVGQYIHALLGAMLPLGPGDDFLIYCNKKNQPNYDFPAANSRTKVWGLSSQPRPVRLGWEYLFLPAELRRQNLDVFHGASNFVPLARVCPCVVSIHDLSYHVHPERCPPVRRAYWYAMTRRSVKTADLIITDSESSRRDIERFFPHAAPKIRMIPLAAHERFRSLEIGREDSLVQGMEGRLHSRPYIFYLGTLEPGKNVGRLVGAFDAIAARFPDHLLVLAGDTGWLCEPIFERMRRSEFAERIVYLGHVNDDEAVHLLNFCDVFAFPSLYEGFGLPPLEAMACGAPVVTSSSSSLPEVVGDAALMINAESENELAVALERVLSDDSLRRDLSRRGLARAGAFSWEETARRTLAVYREASDVSAAQP